MAMVGPPSSGMELRWGSQAGAPATDSPPTGETGRRVLSFEFQKISIPMIPLEKKALSPRVLQVGNAFSFYQSNRGFQDDSEVVLPRRSLGTAQ